MKHILVVDDNVPNLKAAEKALSGIYKATLLTSGTQALKFLVKNTPDLILLDVNMPGIDGFEILRQLRADKENPPIPVIFLTANYDAESEIKGLELGAVDFIQKPFVAQSMLSRIKTHLDMSDYRKNLESMVAEKAKMVEELQNAVSVSIAELVGCRDGYTGDHIKRTCTYIEILAEKMFEIGMYQDELDKQYISDLLRAAALHDIGKVGIKDEILCKPGRFTDSEFEFMKQHTYLGGETLQKAIDQTITESFLYIARDMALYHHEKWDGSGYLQNLSGINIPLCARIMAIADVYDALTSKRPYKEPFGHDKSQEIIIAGRAVAFDPDIVEAFIQCADQFKNALQKFSSGGEE